MLTRTCVIAFLCVFLPLSPLFALDDVPPPVPVAPVKTETLSLSEKLPEKASDIKGLAVVEVFVRRNCPACLKQQAALARHIDHPAVIALSCHTGAFDAVQDVLRLPLPFCDTRHAAYRAALGADPQIVAGGRYIAADMTEAVKTASDSSVLRIPVTRAAGGLFTLSLPVLPVLQDKGYKIWLMVYDRPHSLKAIDRNNNAQDVTYYHAVSNAGFLGWWNGRAKVLTLNAKLTDRSKGFAVIVHDAATGRIAAAGKYE